MARGGGVKGRASKKKQLFFNLFSNVPMFHGPLREGLFGGFPKAIIIIFLWIFLWYYLQLL